MLTTDQVVRILDPRLRGTVRAPGTGATGFNRIVSNRPLAVVAVAGAADVIAAVRFAAERGLPVAVAATGHGPGSPADGGLLIDTGAMSGLRIDPGARTARVDAGLSWGQVVREAAVFGLAPLNGASPSVGAVGYTLGGGHGPLGRSYGYAADHVRSIDLVTADGRFQTLTPEQHTDLFWGVRGGKGNFGVVTAIEVDLFAVPTLYGGGLFLPGNRAREALSTWRDWTTTLPDAMHSALALVRFPTDRALPEPVRGRFLAHIRVAFNGPAAQGERLVRPLRRISEPVLDTVADMSYVDVARIHADPTEPGVYSERSARLTRVADETIETLLAAVDPDAEPLPSVEIRHLEGALGRAPAQPNAVGLRDTAYTVFSGVREDDPERLGAVQAAQRRLIDTLTPWRIGGPFLSFISPLENDPEQVCSAYEQRSYTRLVELKHTHDPTNMFRFTHNIPPSHPDPGR